MGSPSLTPWYSARKIPTTHAGVKLFQPSTAVAAVLLGTVVYMFALDTWRSRAGLQVRLAFGKLTFSMTASML